MNVKDNFVMRESYDKLVQRLAAIGLQLERAEVLLDDSENARGPVRKALHLSRSGLLEAREVRRTSDARASA